jgi:hypothetical protein
MRYAAKSPISLLIINDYKFFQQQVHHQLARINETINPYRANASPKISIRIMPTNNLSCKALQRMPTSPTFPIE